MDHTHREREGQREASTGQPTIRLVHSKNSRNGQSHNGNSRAKRREREKGERVGDANTDKTFRADANLQLLAVMFPDDVADVELSTAYFHNRKKNVDRCDECSLRLAVETSCEVQCGSNAKWSGVGQLL